MGGVNHHHTGTIEYHRNKKGLVAVSRGCYNLMLPGAVGAAGEKITSANHHHNHPGHHHRIMVNEKTTPSTQINSDGAQHYSGTAGGGVNNPPVVYTFHD